MPDSLQAVATLVVAILPGFVATLVDRATRPVRTHSTLEAVSFCVLFSIIIHAVAAPLATWIAISAFGFDPTEPARIGWDKWLDNAVGHHIIVLEAAVGIYLVTSVILAVPLGIVTSRFTSNVVPTWYRETVQRSTTRGWFTRKPKTGLSVMVEMDNSDKYFGTLWTVPADYEVLNGKEKDFSMVNVTFLPKGNANEKVELLPGEVVLLNTRNVASMRLVEETLDTLSSVSRRENFKFKLRSKRLALYSWHLIRDLVWWLLRPIKF